MKKFFLFALMALVSALQGWAYDFEVDGIYYTITGSHVVSVVKGTYDYDGDVTIPKTVSNGAETFSVTGIGEGAFKSCGDLTSVTMPEGLTSIGNEAFYKSSIKTVSLPSTLNSMGASAFRECKNLTGIVLPDALKEIKEYAFRECSNLKTMTLGNQTVNIEQYAFSHTSIENVVIPSSVKNVAQSAFEENSSMKSLVINDAAVFLDYHAFYRCTGLTSVDLGNAVTGFGYYYEYGVFQDCTSLTKVIIPASVTQLQATFRGCSRLYDVTLPEGMTTIGNWAFENCAIKELTIPASVTSIGDNAFYRCPLASITFPASLMTIGQRAFENTSLTEVTIPQSVTEIKAWAFNDCKSLKKVKVENAPVMMTAAFPQCTALTDVDLGNAVVKLSGTSDWGCFRGCTSLKSIKLPNTTNVGIYCFYECTALEDVTLPNTLRTIGHHAFYNCRQLRKISLPNTLQTIEQYAFYGCSGLQTVSLPQSLKTIEQNGFDLCSSLKEILIPEGLTTLGSSVFSSNYALESVVFDNTVVAINEQTFFDCKSLKNVELGKVTSIADRAFEKCTRLESIVIPNSVESLGGAFKSCSSLKKAVIGTGVKAIGGYDGLFRDCPKLTSVEIKSNVLTSVGDRCFYNCRSIKRIDLPASVTSIGQRVFDGCSELSHIYMNPTTPPGISDNTFSDYNTPTLHVPAEAKTSYTKADNWKNFTNVIAIGSEPKATAEEIAALDALLTEALALYNGSVEGTEPGNYRTGAKAAFKAVIDDVQARFSDNMLAEDVEDCTELLTTAIKSFKNKQVKNDIQTNNTLDFAKSLKAATGSEFRLPIEMNNTDAITGVQFDLYLPEGMQLSQDEYGDYNIELSERTTSRRHSVASRVMPDGALRVVVSSTQNATFEGNSGTLLTLVLFPSSMLEAGDYDVELKNVILTDPDATRYAAPDIKSVITVSTYTMGDVNNDGYIDVADLAGVVRFILENADASLVFNAADMDGNGVVEINDYAALVNVILNQSSPSSSSMRRASSMLSDVISLSISSEGELTVSLPVNDMRYTGMQFDLRLPEGIELADEGAETADNRHGAWMQRRADGTYRIVCASMTNDMFGEGEVLRLQVRQNAATGEDAEAVCENVVLSDVDAVRHEAASAAIDLKSGDATGIMSATTSGEAASVYDLQGRRVSQPGQGLYIVNGKKVIIK